LIGVSIVVFCMVRAIPGDPAQIMLGQTATPSQIKEVSDRLGLDELLPVLYMLFVKDAARGDLGESIVTGRPVVNELLVRFPATLELTAFAMIIAILVGVPVGVISAVRQYSLLDKVVSVTALTGISMPIFWLAMILIVIFGVNLELLPFPGRLGPTTAITSITGLVLVDSLLTLNFAGFWDGLLHLIMPAIALGTIPMAVIMRMTRSSMLEVLRQEYVTSARAKGLIERTVVYRHAFRNALIPVVTVAGVQVGYLLGGAIIIERIFALPGVGTLILNGISQRDYPVVQAGVLFVATTFVLVNLIVDVAYAYLDPRIHYG
jgi:peptide/nickel transport system permease protein